MKTALIFSPKGGNVNSVTVQLGEMIGKDKTDIFHVKEVAQEDINNYNQIILLGSTVGADHWNNEIIEDEWQEFFENLTEKSFENKKTAIVGLGNSVIYPDHFADGMAMLYKKANEKGAEIFGFTTSEGYDFTDSEALNDDGLFCGLPIDDDNEDELTSERLGKWIDQLGADFDF